MRYTLESLRAKTLDQRDTLYRNCLRNGGPEADAIIEMLKQTGPYVKGKALAHGDPIYRQMEIIINRSDSVEKMLDMASMGRPPLEAIDPILAAELGGDYGSHNEGTVTAGYLVGQVFYARAFEKTRALPLKGCVAKTASTFRKKRTG